MSRQDSNNIKKSILMRYPNSYLSEVSRTLIGYKSFRDLKQFYKALNVFDTLLDYLTLDPTCRKRIYDMTEEEKKQSKHYFIQLPKDLVESFRRVYHGPRANGKIALRFLAPGKQIDPAKGVVTIRQPVNFLAAWGRYDPEYIVIKGGFYYKETRYQLVQGMGFMPYDVKVPTIDFADPNLSYHETITIPYHYWALQYEQAWTEMGSDCTMIEKIIAELLEDAGYNIEADGAGILAAGSEEADEDAEKQENTLQL